MTTQRDIPRFALTRQEAADAISVSLTTFKNEVQPELRIIRRGRLRLVPTSELSRWVSENAERPMAEEVAAA